MIKLGPFVQIPTDMAMAWSRVAPVVKQIDGHNALEAAPPGAITIYRKYYDVAAQDINRNGADLANEIIASLGGYRPTYIGLYNETSQGLGENCKDNIPAPNCGLMRFVQLHKEAAPVIHAYGSLLIGYDFSTWSHPQPGEWQYMGEQNYGDVDAIAIHEYWGAAGFTEANALWHRVIHRQNPNHPPFIITETGRDPVEGASCNVRDCGWIAQGISADQYVMELVQYNSLIGDDPYVLGATPFISGPDPSWTNHDMDRITVQLLSALGSGIQAPPVVSEPPVIYEPPPGTYEPPPILPPKQVIIPLWARIPKWAYIVGGLSGLFALLAVAEPGVSEAGAPVPGRAVYTGGGIRQILEGQAIPAGYRVIGSA